MGIYDKLQNMRVELQSKNIKKTGENKFAGYSYYELGDILPPINCIMASYKVASVVTFGSDTAELKLVDCENPSDCVTFCCPMATANLKGAHDVQNLGAVISYIRRYLYLTAFEVVESDFFDATQGMPENPAKKETPKPKETKPKPALTMGKQLNAAIKAYSDLTGIPVGVVLDDINETTGKNPDNMDDAAALIVLDLLRSWTKDFNEKVGA